MKFRALVLRSPILLLALGALTLSAPRVSSQDTAAPPFPEFEMGKVDQEQRDAIEKHGCRALHGVGAKSVSGVGGWHFPAAAAVCESHGSASGFARHYLVACQLQGEWDCQDRGEFLAARLDGRPLNIFMEGDVAEVAFPGAKFALEKQLVKPESRLDITQPGEHWIDQLHVERAGPQLLRFFTENDWVF